MTFPHITVDEVVEHLDGEPRSSLPVRLLVALAVVLVGGLDVAVDGSGALVLLWVPVTAVPAFVRLRGEALLAGAVATAVGMAAMPAGSSVGAVATEGVGRAVVLGTVIAASAWLGGAGRELAQRSRIDGATGLLNRTGFTNALERERQRALRARTPLSLVYFDLDGLKAANDRLGHAAGDVLLGRFARRLDSCRRTIDVAGRLGGDEFVLLLPATDAEGTSQLLDRLFRSGDGVERSLPVSAGAICWAVPPSAEEMLRMADEAMYRVKRSGGGSWTLVDVRVPAAAEAPGRRRRTTVSRSVS